MLAISASARKGAGITKPHVRFGSKADICSATSHVRFPPNSDRESGLFQTVMSALPPKADMCSAVAHVCFGPKADICSAITRAALLVSNRPHTWPGLLGCEVV